MTTQDAMPLKVVKTSSGKTVSIYRDGPDAFGFIVTDGSMVTVDECWGFCGIEPYGGALNMAMLAHD